MADSPPNPQSDLRRWRLDREAAIVLLVSAVFTLPIWLGTDPPMADYPQHLSMASILRWYHDPARHLVEHYTFAYARPNTAFVYLVAALSYLMPIGIAGKLLMAISVAATGPAGLALARRAGRPGWFGLFALISAYDFAFFFGFVNNVIATPLLLYGVVLADRLLDRPMGWRSWLTIALYGCAFYFVHIQFLFLFVGVVGWLTLTRFPGWRNSLWMFSALVFGITMTLLYHFLRHEETFTYNEKRILTTVHESRLVFDKLSEIPTLLFGARDDGTHWLLFLLAALAVLRLCQVRVRSQPVLATTIKDARSSGQPSAAGNAAGREEDAEQADGAPDGCPDSQPSGPTWRRAGAWLADTRFHTLAAWFLCSYLLMPSVFVGVFVYQRLIAVACLLIPAVLPVPEACRLRLAKFVVGITIATHLVLTAEAAYAFDQETRGGHELIAKTQPGKNLMSLGLVLNSSVLHHPLPLYFGAHYLVEKGGRINFSFSELHISMVQLRPDLAFDDLHTTVPGWAPWQFRFDDFGYHFDYFLFRGDFRMLTPIFGKHLSKLDWETRDDWMLLWRKSVVTAH
jgi:hypothetical protein